MFILIELMTVVAQFASAETLVQRELARYPECRIYNPIRAPAPGAQVPEYFSISGQHAGQPGTWVQLGERVFFVPRPAPRRRFRPRHGRGWDMICQALRLPTPSGGSIRAERNFLAPLRWSPSEGPEVLGREIEWISRQTIPHVPGHRIHRNPRHWRVQRDLVLSMDFKEREMGIWPLISGEQDGPRGRFQTNCWAGRQYLGTEYDLTNNDYRVFEEEAAQEIHAQQVRAGQWHMVGCPGAERVDGTRDESCRVDDVRTAALRTFQALENDRSRLEHLGIARAAQGQGVFVRAQRNGNWGLYFLEAATGDQYFYEVPEVAPFGVMVMPGTSRAAAPHEHFVGNGADRLLRESRIFELALPRHLGAWNTSSGTTLLQWQGEPVTRLTTDIDATAASEISLETGISPVRQITNFVRVQDCRAVRLVGP